MIISYDIYPICYDSFQALSERAASNLSVDFDATVLGQGLCYSKRIQLHIRISMCESFEDGRDDIAGPGATWTSKHEETAADEDSSLTLVLPRPGLCHRG